MCAGGSKIKKTIARLPFPVCPDFFSIPRFSKNLKKVLNSREQSGENFAKEVKIAASTLYQILKGDCLSSVKTFYAIVKVLNVSADTLLTSKNEGGAAA